MLQLPAGKVGLFGYGSLLLLSSMERTLGRRYEGERHICHLNQWHRVWNSLYPNERYYFTGPSGDRCYPKNILYLNVERAAGLLNGLIYAVSEDDLLEFDKREAFYSRVDVADDITDVRVSGGPVFTYVGRAPYVLRSEASMMEAAVRRSYVNLVGQGVESLGPEFRATYEGSTDPPPPSNVMDDKLD